MPTQSLSSYAKYVDGTEDLLSGILTGSIQQWKESCLRVLDGEPWAELRKAVDLEHLRTRGAFFTSQPIASLAINPRYFADLDERVITAIDPACGAGDLLLLVASRLEMKPTLSETLARWGEQLKGFDQSELFVRLAKVRLVLLAVQRGALASPEAAVDLSKVFPGIRCTDGLLPSQELERADLVALNPPFFLTAAPEGCTWAKGRITAAAHFFERSLLTAKTGARIIAILPEVLRTGSRYGKWRKFVEQHSTIHSVLPLGLFAKTVDVHVFILVVTKGAPAESAAGRWWKTKRKRQNCSVAEFFDVHVGSVVPHRHRKVGPSYPYIHARSAPAWARVNRIAEVRRFKGTTFTTPFVAIRRTSRPEDEFRAVATLITHPGSVAVENHLIVCRPKDGTINECKKLIRLLKTKETNALLNERIRCRHLTVPAIRDLPFAD